MLPFFRKIRKALLDSGRLSRYLIYAIGEILLVMIGILLALQVNNWNEWRKNRAEEQQILQGLKVEFESHLKALDNQLNSTEDLLSGMMLFMSYIAESDSQYSITELDKGLYNSLWAGTWDPANNHLNSLIASGHLHLIMNTELRSKLASWSSVVDEIRDNQVSIRDHAIASLWSGLAENGVPNIRGWGKGSPALHTLMSEKTSEVHYQKIKGNLEIINLLAMKYEWTNWSLKEIKWGIQEVEQIIALISKELGETG